MLKKIQNQDQDFSRLQDNIDSVLPNSTTLKTVTVSSGRTSITNEEVSPPFIGGNLIAYALTSGADNLIPHGLNRRVTSWVITSLDTNATIWSPTTATLSIDSVPQSTNQNYLNLRCSASCSIKVWVN